MLSLHWNAHQCNSNANTRRVRAAPFMQVMGKRCSQIKCVQVSEHVLVGWSSEPNVQSLIEKHLGDLQALAPGLP